MWKKVNGEMRQRRINQMESAVKYQNCSTPDKDLNDTHSLPSSENFLTSKICLRHTYLVKEQIS